MKKITMLLVISLLSCTPMVRYDVHFIKIPNNEENAKIVRECQSSIATALIAQNPKGIKYRCYSTFKNQEDKVVKYQCKSGDIFAGINEDYCIRSLIGSYIPKGCTFIDEECNPSIKNSISSSDVYSALCMYLLCEPDVVIPDKEIFTKQEQGK